MPGHGLRDTVYSDRNIMPDHGLRDTVFLTESQCQAINYVIRFFHIITMPGHGLRDTVFFHRIAMPGHGLHDAFSPTQLAS
jgi:hypothetical protein